MVSCVGKFWLFGRCYEFVVLVKLKCKVRERCAICLARNMRGQDRPGHAGLL